MPPSKRLRCDDPEWTRRKAAIEEMYVFDRLSQIKIRQKLADDGFHVTKSELEAELRFWNIRKNASRDVSQYTDYRLIKREEQGKDSVVYYNGRKVTRTTLKKERSRYQPDMLTRCMETASPKPPEGIELWIRTPTPAPLQSRWAQTLPWLRFQHTLLPTILNFTNQATNMEQRSRDSRVQIDPSSLHQPLYGVPSRDICDFAANIASMMPEKVENEIVNCAQLIFGGEAVQAFNEHIKLILYSLSNNMYQIDYDDDSSWSTIVTLIERSGLTNQPLDLVHEKDSTITSIAENLFKLCIEFRIQCAWSEGQTSNSKVIAWLLRSGQNPDVQVRAAEETLFALQDAARAYDCQLAFDILAAGGDPNKSFEDEPPPLLSLLMDVFDKFREITPEERGTLSTLVQRLLEAGASLNEGRNDEGPSALMWAVRLDLQTADMLIQHGAKIEHKVTHREFVTMDPAERNFSKTETVLGFAILGAEDEKEATIRMQHIVEHVQRPESSVSVADLDITDALCIAASKGFDSVIEILYPMGHNAVMAEASFEALCAASYAGHWETCELLLRYGAPTYAPG